MKKLLKNMLSTFSVLLLLVTVFSFGSSVNQAEAVSCHKIVNPAEAVRFDEYPDLIVGATTPYDVPGSSVSGCKDINVQNITWLGAPDANPHCGNFRVKFYPSGGGSYVNSWKWACSTPPNGPLIPIATGVYNGTNYRVEYIANPSSTPKPAFHYTIWD